jgi:RimJ/RimL family protein N-acetyltransferase
VSLRHAAGSSLSAARPKIVTPRLTLEPTSPSHAEGVWAAIEPSLPELRPWMSWAMDSSLSTVERFTIEADEGWSNGTSWPFTILKDGVVGGVVAFNGYKPVLSTTELGYWIATSLAGYGLMTEAAAAVVDWGFATLGLHRIELRAAPGNINSVRVAEKVGFQREGVARSACRGSEGWHDVVTFGLLDEDPRLLP